MVALRVVSTILVLCAALVSALPTPGSLQNVANYGSNPAGVPMYIYVPNKLATKPGIIVAVYVIILLHCFLSFHDFLCLPRFQ
jgi:hypothetical protein